MYIIMIFGVKSTYHGPVYMVYVKRNYIPCINHDRQINMFWPTNIQVYASVWLFLHILDVILISLFNKKNKRTRFIPYMDYALGLLMLSNLMSITTCRQRLLLGHSALLLWEKAGDCSCVLSHRHNDRGIPLQIFADLHRNLLWHHILNNLFIFLI